MSSSPEPLEGRQRLAPGIRQALVVDAASRVLARSPDWTVAEVAEEAGISEKLIYRYYPGGALDQLAEKVAEKFVGQIPRFLDGLPLEMPHSQQELRELAETVIGRALDWVETVDGAWMFGPERDRLSALVGEHWEQGQRAIAGMLARLNLPGLTESPVVRSGLYSELKAFESLAYDFKRGLVTRDQFEAIAIGRAELLFGTLLPALSD